MLQVLRLCVGGCVLLVLGGCALQEIRSRSSVGPEFRSSGTGNDRTNNVRWSVQQGLQFNWENGVDTAVTYRRRDEDNGGSDRDNGVWFEVSLPVWRNENAADPKDQRIRDLEQRVAKLEARLAEGAPQ